MGRCPLSGHRISHNVTFLFGLIYRFIWCGYRFRRFFDIRSRRWVGVH